LEWIFLKYKTRERARGGRVERGEERGFKGGKRELV
jgi:hypothetical protein